MKLRSARTRDPEAPTAIAEESKRTLTGEHHSPGLQAALEAVRERQSVRVLDLGPAVATNFEFLSEFGRHIRFADLVGEDGPISELGGGDELQLRRRARELLPPDWGIFDLVIAWDLINYLDDTQVKPIAERLRDLCRDGAILFVMIATIGEVPAKPPKYTIVDRSTLLASSDSAEVVECPRRPPAAVERLLRGFSVERSFILRHGVQEYVAVRQ